MNGVCRSVGLLLLLVSLANAQGPIYVIRTGAMGPTFLEGDHILALPYESSSDFRRGDVIVFRFPPQSDVILVKRLMGLPGDRLRITDHQLILNSKTLDEKYVKHWAGADAPTFDRNFPLGVPAARELFKDNLESGELVIPPGRYFVLGDNRDYSYDSRSWGFVTASQIVGLVREIISSVDPKTKSLRSDRFHVAVQRVVLKQLDTGK